MNDPVSKKTLKKRNRSWILLGGIFIVIYLLALLYNFLGTSRNVGLALYYLNGHHWPWWYGLNLWIIAAGSVFSCFVTRRRTRYRIYAAALTAAAAVTITHISPFYPFFLHLYNTFIIQTGRFYRAALVPWFYVPVTDFFTDGTVSGRLFIVPAAAILLIGALLDWNRRIKKESKTPNQDQEQNHERDQKS